MPASASDIVVAYGIDRALADRIVEVARALGIPDAAMLANVVNFESAGFNPRAKNPVWLSGCGGGNATGLIQFTPCTAQELGTTTEAIGRMSAVDQMALVQRYFMLPRIAKYGPLRTQEDVYMAVFYPKAIGNPDYLFPTDVQQANPGIATPRDYAAKANRIAKMTVQVNQAAHGGRYEDLEMPKILPRPGRG